MGIFNIEGARRALDLLDQPVPYAKRYFFRNRTSNMAPLFSDSELTNLRANPMTADENGYFDPVYLLDGEYQVVLENSKGVFISATSDVKVTGSLLSEFVHSYDTVAKMLDNEFLSYTTDTGLAPVSPGQRIGVDAGRFSYEIAAPDATDHHLTTASGLKLYVLPGSDGAFNVRAWNIRDGVDSSAEWQNLFDNMPRIETGYGPVGGYSSGGVMIVIPFGNYSIDTKVHIPSNVSLTMRGSGGWSPRISGAADHAFCAEGSPSGVFGWTEFDGIAFHNTGIEIASNRRGKTVIRRCNFVASPSAAILGSGDSIVGVVIEDNKFTSCAGSCCFLGLDVDLLEIRRNDFVRGHTHPDVDLGTYSALVDFNDFETRLITDATVPWIRLIRGGNRINQNRFGDEIVGTTYAPPRDAIQIGPDVPDGIRVADTHIAENNIRGTNGTTGPSQSSSFVRLNAPVSNLRFVDNIIAEAADFYSAIIHEAYIDDNPADSRKSYNNLARSNFASSTLTAPLFSRGGLGFTCPDREGNDSQMSRTNLLRQSTDVTQSLWLKTNVTATQDATGPDGVPDSATRLTKNGTGAAHVRTQLVGINQNVSGDAVVSVWLRGAEIKRAQVYLVQSTDNIPLVGNKVVPLSDQWQRFDLSFSSIDPTKSYFLYIGPASFMTSDLDALGSISVYQPSAWNGFDAPLHPLANAHAGGTQHAPQQFNGLILGNSHIGYGSGAPASGRYEVGDLVYNTAPSAGGFVGWVCTGSGSPGTWKTFGQIAT